MNSQELAARRLAEAVEVRRTLTSIWSDAANDGGSLDNRQAARVRDLTEKADDLEASAARLLKDSENEQRAASMRLPQHGSRVTTVYDRGEQSFLRDLFASNRGDSRAAARLAQHDEFQLEQMDAESRSLFDMVGIGAFSPVITANQAGYQQAPTTGRPFVDWLNPGQLPVGGSIEVPVFDQAFTAGPKADGTALVPTSAPSVGTATAAPILMAASTRVTWQALETSDPPYETVLLEGLTAAYHQAYEAAAIGGDGNGTLEGPLALGTANHAIAFGTADATGQGFVMKIAEAIADISEDTFEVPAAVWMHPRRYAWLLSRKADDDSPLLQAVVPNATPNALRASGYAGSILGVDLYLSGGIATDYGSDQDRVLVMTRSAIRGWQQAREPRRITLDLDASNLIGRLTVVGLVAQATTRPSGIRYLDGAGLGPPFA